MKPPYTQHFGAFQDISAGEQYAVTVTPPPGGAVVRLDFVAMYWGAPSSVASNSCVIQSGVGDVGSPNLVAYDSGITGSANPIYQSFSPRYAFPWLPESEDAQLLFVITNTSFSQSVDVSCSGIVLTGAAPLSSFGYFVP